MIGEEYEPPAEVMMPVLTAGTELVGEFQGSGYRVPPQLVRRGDGQLVRLPPLLYTVLRALDLHHNQAEQDADGRQALVPVVETVKLETGLTLTVDQIVFLVDRKLAPLGVVSYSDGSEPRLPRANPWLALRLRLAVLPEAATWLVSGLFAWLFRPPVMVPLLAMVLLCQVWLFATHSVAQAMQQALYMPASILLILAITLLVDAFHEIGHASACRYGGAAPGVIGCGIYLVWPCFYTDITDSYRLGRQGRVRADLGGIYFSALATIVLVLAYRATGFTPLLVAVLSTNVAILEQLFPLVRFDGYYILADLIGVPDLFRYIVPALRRTLLRRPEAGLDVLKRWAQLALTAWVLGVALAMVAELLVVVVQVPLLVQTELRMIVQEAAAIRTASPIETAASLVQILLLFFPIAGLAYLAARILRSPIRALSRRLIAALSRPAPSARRRSLPVIVGVAPFGARARLAGALGAIAVLAIAVCSLGVFAGQDVRGIVPGAIHDIVPAPVAKVPPSHTPPAVGGVRPVVPRPPIPAAPVIAIPPQPADLGSVAPAPPPITLPIPLPAAAVGASRLDSAGAGGGWTRSGATTPAATDTTLEAQPPAGSATPPSSITPPSSAPPPTTGSTPTPAQSAPPPAAAPADDTPPTSASETPSAPAATVGVDVLGLVGAQLTVAA